MKNATIALGVVTMLVGAGLFYASFESLSKLMLRVSFLVGVIGFSILQRGFFMSANPPNLSGPPPPDAGRPQIAGRPCASCEKKIAVVFDGYLCDGCDRACHRDCRAAHELAAHAGRAPSAYR